MPTPATPSDLELLILARNGGRDAYGQLIGRHQTLITSIAYSICGDLRLSQEIAQEAFIVAWQQLGSLEDLAKFKAWLCGITRNLGLNLVRRQARRIDQPVAATDRAPEPPDTAPSPSDQAVSREEAAIVWQSLEKLPEIYREPLILFYREQQSVERVAAALDLSEDAVKQRLARGRAMLRDQVESLIERSLGFTTPGVLFTTTVLSALPLAAAQTAATTMAATTAQGAAATKATGLWPWLSSLLNPFLAIPALSLLMTAWQSRFIASFSRSPEERKFMRRLIWITGIISTFAIAAMLGLTWWQHSGQYLYHTRPLDKGTQGFIMLGLLGFGVVAPCLIYFGSHRRFLEYTRNARPPAYLPGWYRKLCLVPSRAVIYRSKLTAFGLPLIDIHFGHSVEQPLVRGTAMGWIAVGDIAHGVIFALGGFAVGGIAVGGIAIGALSIGYVALGLGAFGFVAAGVMAKAILLAIGYVALGPLAVGWEAASGVVAAARQTASGMITLAANTDTTAARHWAEANPIASTLVPAKTIEGILFPVLNAVLALIGINALARYPGDRALPRKITGGSPRYFALPPVFLAWFTVSLVCFALLFHAAIERNSRRLATESAHTRETEIKAAEDEIQAKARRQRGRQLARAGQSAEALAEFLWCFDAGMAQVPGLSAVRVSYLLADIQALGETYPPAKAALRERRDRARAAVLAGQTTDDTVRDLVALNRSLNENDRSLALYDQLPETNARRAELRSRLFAQFLQAKRYDDALQSEPVISIFRMWELQQNHAARRDNSTFSPAAQQAFHEHNVHWLADRLEVLAGASQLEHARELLTQALAYDSSTAAMAAYHTSLDRAGHGELLAKRSGNSP